MCTRVDEVGGDELAHAAGGTGDDGDLPGQVGDDGGHRMTRG
ncbi:hypothetical protein AB0M80_43440 [Amycolatopsis sp. NPDC051045]